MALADKAGSEQTVRRDECDPTESMRTIRYEGEPAGCGIEHVLRKGTAGLESSVVQDRRQHLFDKLRDITADALAYVLMASVVPLAVGLVYMAMRGMKAGWRWLFRLLKIWIDIFVSPFCKFRRPPRDTLLRTPSTR